MNSLSIFDLVQEHSFSDLLTPSIDILTKGVMVCDRRSLSRSIWRGTNDDCLHAVMWSQKPLNVVRRTIDTTAEKQERKQSRNRYRSRSLHSVDYR